MQHKDITNEFIRTMPLLDIPTIGMLGNMTTLFGLDQNVIIRFFSNAANNNAALCKAARSMGAFYFSLAQTEENRNNIQEALTLYENTVTSYFLAEWFTCDLEETNKNYTPLLAAHDKIRQYSFPKVEKVLFPCYAGNVYAHLSLPDPVFFKPPYPTLLMLQGNDGVKELMLPFERCAMSLGFAICNFDPPGWGESYASGNIFKDTPTFQRTLKDVIDYLETRIELDTCRLASFGPSLGGLITHYAAGLDDRIKASAGIGAPFLNVFEMRKTSVSERQNNRTYIFTGTKNEKELIAWWKNISMQEHLQKVNCPCLIVHGKQDMLVPVKHAYAIADVLNSDVTVRIVPEGDHMCSHNLYTEVAPYMFSWIKEQLG